MSLPIALQTPRYSCTLPSSNQLIEYRPYIVKEEKLLLIANESNDSEQIALTLKNVLELCTFAKIDIASLAIFDIEYLYLMIRARSRGEELELNIKCNNILKDTGVECGHSTKVKFNLISDVKVKRNELHTTKVALTEDITVYMRYPNFTSLLSSNGDVSTSSEKLNQAFIQLAKCIEAIISKDQEIYTKDYTVEDILEFIESLTESQFTLLSQFIDTMPKVIGTISYTCKKCGFKHKAIEVTGLQDFLS